MTLFLIIFFLITNVDHAAEEPVPDGGKGTSFGIHMSFGSVTSILGIVAALVGVIAFVMYHCVVYCRRPKPTVGIN